MGQKQDESYLAAYTKWMQLMDDLDLRTKSLKSGFKSHGKSFLENRFLS